MQVPSLAETLDPCRGETSLKQLALRTNETTSRKDETEEGTEHLFLPSLCTDILLLLLNHQVISYSLDPMIEVSECSRVDT